ncbi:hypothetical protein ALIPUT_01058 [Alistipes putredinis DSM 17216]|uniref:Uncharacterized protein n=1 Tax=Alistipes putredinis DSM 17216 TaxID=445970 RepID=B0MVB1_9BACT|nr:hypothetical protein ALIPUT_01058 [Alistipes putredinis DSM 17216]
MNSVALSDVAAKPVRTCSPRISGRIGRFLSPALLPAVFASRDAFVSGTGRKFR